MKTSSRPSPKTICCWPSDVDKGAHHTVKRKALNSQFAPIGAILISINCSQIEHSRVVLPSMLIDGDS
eukprot:scaffold44213_cov19-Prasinocladus_malaysianus.AAC.1